MSDIKKDENVSVDVTPQVLNTDEGIKPEENQDKTGEDIKSTLVNDEKFRLELKEEITNDLAKVYTEKLETQQKMIKGLDRKNTELQKKLREYETKELTEEQKFELREKEIKEKERTLWRREAITNLPFSLEDEEKNEFMSYLHGDSEEDIQNAVGFLGSVFQKYLQTGIEKGVDERFKQSGYKPSSAGLNKNDTNDLANMTKNELTEYANKVAKMQSGDEKDKELNKLDKELTRRFQEGG